MRPPYASSAGSTIPGRRMTRTTDMRASCARSHRAGASSGSLRRRGDDTPVARSSRPRPRRAPRSSPSWFPRRAPRRRRPRACRERRSRLPASPTSRQHVLGRRALGELRSLLDGEAERTGERLDGLAAADVRAREHAPDVVTGESGHEALGLSAAPVVERSQLIELIVLPVDTVAGSGVAEEEDGGQRDSSSANALRISRSRS